MKAFHTSTVLIQRITMQSSLLVVAELRIMVCRWPFSDTFQYMTEQNPICYDKFTVHFFSGRVSDNVK